MNPEPNGRATNPPGGTTILASAELPFCDSGSVPSRKAPVMVMFLVMTTCSG